MLFFLKMLKEKGKKLFLLTNSPYYFVEGGMRFMLEVIVTVQDDLMSFIAVIVPGSTCPVSPLFFFVIIGECNLFQGKIP